MLKINFKGLDEKLSCIVNELKNGIGINVNDNGVAVNISKRETHGLTVKIADGKADVFYGIIPDFCRGLCILKDALEKGKTDFLYDADRGIEKSGIMLDLSRNAVVRVETAKDLIRRCARMGLNTFMLYTEDTYEIEGYPYFGHLRGRYTKAEMKELIAKADELLRSYKANHEGWL